LIEQGQIDVQVRSLVDWERGLGSLNMDCLTATSNNLHVTVGLQVRQTAVNIWCIGRVLMREKELVGQGIG